MIQKNNFIEEIYKNNLYCFKDCDNFKTEESRYNLWLKNQKYQEIIDFLNDFNKKRKINLINIYGGFIRDILCGNSPKDIDISCGINDSAYDDFTIEIIKLLKRTQIIEFGFENNYKMKVCGRKIINLEKEITFELFHYRLIANQELHQPDVNINRLYLDEYKLQTYNKCSENIIDIIKDICDKRFKYEAGCPEFRRKKLIDNGWEVNENFLLEQIIK